MRHHDLYYFDNKRLRQLREQKGLKVCACADKLGVNAATWSNYEGGRRIPQEEHIPKIALMFNVAPSHLKRYKIEKPEPEVAPMGGTEPFLPLEAGKLYRTESGRRAQVSGRTTHIDYPVRGTIITDDGTILTTTWTTTGRFDKTKPNANDIVGLWFNSAPLRVATPEELDAPPTVTARKITPVAREARSTVRISSPLRAQVIDFIVQRADKTNAAEALDLLKRI